MSRYGRIALEAVLLTVVVAAAAGCGGGGGGSAPQNNATVAPLTSPMTAVQKEIAGLPLAQQAPIPKGLNCKGDVVWANIARKNYHREGDPYFGRTKHGQYMCEAAADAAGYHLAGTRHSSTNSTDNTSGSMNNMQNMSNMSNSSGTMSGSSHHHHKTSSSGGN